MSRPALDGSNGRPGTGPTYLARLGGLCRRGAAPEAILAALCDRLADRLGAPVRLEVPVGAGAGPGAGLTGGAGGAPALRPGDVDPPGDLVGPELLGQVYEHLADPSCRHRAGIHYTPPATAASLVDFALAGAGRPAAVCDPAVGGGVFLLAVARHLGDALPAGERVGVLGGLHGCDTDPLAVAVARATLALWAGGDDGSLARNLVVGDALDQLPGAVGATGGMDLVVGNPPFLSQLGRETARSAGDTARLRSRFGGVVTGYVDTAALFLVRALELLEPGGRAALIQPHGTLATRDAAAVRAHLVERARLVGVWFAAEAVFRAGVRVWAPVLEVPGPHRRGEPVARRQGPTLAPATAVASRPELAEGAWTHLVADLVGCPDVPVPAGEPIGTVAEASAGFRDQYYGLVGAVVEDAPPDGDGPATVGGAGSRPRLVTSGLIDVLGCAWGERPVRFARRTYQRPVVELSAASASAVRWVRRWSGPKVLVATQTPVIEAVVDEAGDLVPSTPVIALRGESDSLWLLAAALCAPPLSAYALARALGAALSVSTIKLSARQVLALPLPTDRRGWDRAAEAAREVGRCSGPGEARRAALAEYGHEACLAYGVDPASEVLGWWLDRCR